MSSMAAVVRRCERAGGAVQFVDIRGRFALARRSGGVVDGGFAGADRPGIGRRRAGGDVAHLFEDAGDQGFDGEVEEVGLFGEVQEDLVDLDVVELVVVGSFALDVGTGGGGGLLDMGAVLRVEEAQVFVIERRFRARRAVGRGALALARQLRLQRQGLAERAGHALVCEAQLGDLGGLLGGHVPGMRLLRGGEIELGQPRQHLLLGGGCVGAIGHVGEENMAVRQERT
jgi:hypothetical protein